MINAAGLNVAGDKNPNWHGGPSIKQCEQCRFLFAVIPGRKEKARFCSLPCANKWQEKHPYAHLSEKCILKVCEVCGINYSCFLSHAHRHHCCSKECSYKNRSIKMHGADNSNWNGGISRLPYPWNFKKISKSILERDGYACQNPSCEKKDDRLVTHHVDYNKENCEDYNLITLCCICNSKANFHREKWEKYYMAVQYKKGIWVYERF